jgi:hypothetical protein
MVAMYPERWVDGGGVGHDQHGLLLDVHALGELRSEVIRASRRHVPPEAVLLIVMSSLVQDGERLGPDLAVEPYLVPGGDERGLIDLAAEVRGIDSMPYFLKEAFAEHEEDRGFVDSGEFVGRRIGRAAGRAGDRGAGDAEDEEARAGDE